MTNIAEMIPENMPGWAIKAMANGQLFNITFDRIARLEKALNEIIKLPAVRQDEGCCIAMGAMDNNPTPKRV